MLLNVSQAARELGISTETLRRNIRAKRWPFYVLGPKSTRVDPDEIKTLGRLTAESKSVKRENAKDED